MLMGFSIINHVFGGTPVYGNYHMTSYDILWIVQQVYHGESPQVVGPAFCLFLAVPLVRFSTLFSPFFCVAVFNWGGLGECNNVMSLTLYLTPLF